MRATHELCWATLLLLSAIGSGACGDDADDGLGNKRGGLESEGTAITTVACDLAKPFEAPTVLPGFDTRDVFSARLAPDESKLFLSVWNGASDADFVVATRATPTSPYVIEGPIAELNTPSAEYWPALSPDGRLMYFESDRPLVNGPGAPVHDVARVWVAMRPTVDAPFGAPFVLDAFRSSPTAEGAPYVDDSGHTIYFASMRKAGTGGLDLYTAEVDDYGVVTSVEPIVETPEEMNMPLVTHDERVLFYAQYGTSTARDIWVTARGASSGPFGGLRQKVVELSTSYDEWPSAISPDDCRLYFISNRPAPDGVSRYRVWVASKPPPAP